MQIDEPPPDDLPNEPGTSSGSGPPPPPRPSPPIERTPSRDEPDAEGTPQGGARQTSTSSSSSSSSSSDTEISSVDWRASLFPPTAQTTQASGSSTVPAPKPGTSGPSGTSGPTTSTSSLSNSAPSRSREPGTQSGSRDQPRLERPENFRSRSRTPPRGPLRSNQGQNANDAYFVQLTDYSREAEYYLPTFTFTKDSKKASQIRGKQWEDIMFETTVDVYDEDLELFKSPTASPKDLTDHLAYMLSDAKRKTEVSLKNLTAEKRRWMKPKTKKWINGSQIPSSKLHVKQEFP